jgi:aryl-alcohol dehydrogenase-like predicted oxidoreductase
MTGREPRLSGVALGCMGMSWAYSPSKRDAARCRQVIALAVEAGVGMVDTADVYGLGANEELVGAALRAHRGSALIATKGGLVKQPGLERPVPCGTPQHLRSAVDGSLRRLGVDAIDLFYLHRTDPAVPLEESWGALAERNHPHAAVLLGAGRPRGPTAQLLPHR